MKFIKQLTLFLGLVTLMLQLSWAAPIAGHVILTKGNVTAVMENGDSRSLKRRSEIFNGDVIKTGPAGSVQIRFVDKALMTIKANSEMNIESYLMAQQSESGDKEQVLMSLVKGGFRTITGTIGKGNKDAYKVNTPAASIGIRGTNYEVQEEADGGFVMGVYSGGIQVENEAGTIELGEGADFNFTRVKPKSSPKGLLAPPPTLAENSATEQNEEESEGEQTASEESSDEGNGEAQEETEEVVENNEGDDSPPSNSALAEFEGTNTNIGDEVSNAIDNKLAGQIEETVEKVEDIIKPTIPGDVDFDFEAPFNGVDSSSVNNPFTEEIISDQQFALAETGKLALLAIPVNSSNSYAGDSPSLSTFEAQLVSPNLVSSNFTNEDYSGANETRIRIHYDLINISTGEKDEYEIEIIFDGAINDIGTLENHISTALAENDYRLNGELVSGSAPSNVSFSYNSSEDRFEFKPTTTSESFIMEMELDFDDESSASSQALQQQLGSNTNFNRDDWYAESGLDMVIGNGSWDSTNNKPILVMRDKHSYQDQDNTTVTDERIEVVTKPLEADATVGSLLAFASCADSTPQQTCDIQVDSVTASENIRWGAWLAEAGEGIQITSFNVGDSTLEFQQEEDILAFWIAAERADINQLIGNATFSANSDCAKFNQCIGFADDGIVQSLTAQFDVNFTSGAITNGNLTLQTTEDPDLGILGGTGDVMSTWNVNFTGQMSSSDDGTVKLPEFQTQSISGTVVEQTGSSNAIIGNIGGIFVKPGDKFAGGYNLGTADGTNKHAAGVFSMDKQ
ncbi:MAG: FecR domain-containing protein [Bermanella sp.]